jgi:hypothetical protein
MNLKEPIIITFLYGFVPLSMFHPFLRGIVVLILTNPNSDTIPSKPTPFQNLLATSLQWQ